jgi:hypothetical protein
MHTVPASEQWLCAPLMDDPSIVHVWPFLDVLRHVAEETCPCIPRIQPVVVRGEVLGSCVIHNHHYLMN